MRRLALIASVGLFSLAFLFLVPLAEAQRLPQHARAFVQSPHVMARGGTAMGIAGPETALFYNPAHLARLELERPRVEIASVQGGISTNFFGNLGFLTDDLQTAIDDGLSIPLTQSERDLFNEALERGRRPTVGQAALTLPSVMMSSGNVGFGGGLFATNVTRFRFNEAGGGVPIVDLFSQFDVIAAGGAATLIPNTPLAAGGTIRFVQRYLASKDRNVLMINPDNEQLYVLSGTTLALDVGLHAADVLPMLPGQVDLGIAVHDLIGGGFSYSHNSSVNFTGDGAVNQRELDRILASFEDRDGAISVRLGGAYSLSTLGPFEDFSVGLDWYSRSTSQYRQPALAGIRLGAEGRVAGPLTLRAGIGQGYPSLGFSVDMGFANLDYSLFGVEEGRLPGQLQRYNHLLRLRFGLF